MSNEKEGDRGEPRGPEECSAALVADSTAGAPAVAHPDSSEAQVAALMALSASASPAIPGGTEPILGGCAGCEWGSLFISCAEPGVVWDSASGIEFAVSDLPVDENGHMMLLCGECVDQCKRIRSAGYRIWSHVLRTATKRWMVARLDPKNDDLPEEDLYDLLPHYVAELQDWNRREAQREARRRRSHLSVVK